MARPYRTEYTPKKRTWTKAELEDLYVERNFCMELVSDVTGIPMAPLSRLLWEYGLPDRKREVWGPNFSGELKKLPDDDMAEFFDASEELVRSRGKPTQDEMEDEFFSELGGG